MKRLIIFCALLLLFLNLKAQIANNIKGKVIDTSSTAILSFNIDLNSKVENLIKLFPGIQVFFGFYVLINNP